MTQRELFESLTKEHLRSLWSTALRMTGCRETADDLVQEACLRAFRSFSDYEPGTNYKAWIFRILTNLCRDNLRRESRSPLRQWDDAEVERVTENYHCGIQQPDGELQTAELTSATHEAMSRLSPKIRVVVALSLLGDFSYMQVAQLLNIPVGTVRSRLSRGRMQLQQELFNHINDHTIEAEPAQVSNHSTAKTEGMQIVPEPAEHEC